MLKNWEVVKNTGKCNDANLPQLPLIDEHVISVVLLELVGTKRSNFGKNAFDHGHEADWQLR